MSEAVRKDKQAVVALKEPCMEPQRAERGGGAKEGERGLGSLGLWPAYLGLYRLLLKLLQPLAVSHLDL